MWDCLVCGYHLSSVGFSSVGLASAKRNWQVWDGQVWAVGLASVGLITDMCGIPNDGLAKCRIYIALRFDQFTSCQLRPDNNSIW